MNFAAIAPEIILTVGALIVMVVDVAAKGKRNLGLLTTLIIVLAVMTGFESDLRDKILGTNSHVVVLMHGKSGITDYREIVEKVKKEAHVVAATPFIYSQAMLSSPQSVSGIVESDAQRVESDDGAEHAQQTDRPFVLGTVQDTDYGPRKYAHHDRQTHAHCGADKKCSPGHIPEEFVILVSLGHLRIRRRHDHARHHCRGEHYPCGSSIQPIGDRPRDRL